MLQRIRRPLVKKLSPAFLALAAGWASTDAAHAQQPTAAMPRSTTQKIHVQSGSFRLPITMDDSTLARTREVWLFMKEPAGEWIRKDAVHPATRAFQLHLNKDGEYWFSVVTVDLNGTPTPSNVSKLPPHMIVVVQGAARPEPTAQSQRIQVQAAEDYATPNVLHPSAIQSQPIQVHETATVHPRLNVVQGMQPKAAPPVQVPPSPVAPLPNVQHTATVHHGTPIIPNAFPATPASFPSVNGNRQLVGTTKVGIDYNINKVGPSGLSKIEVWCTRDVGRSWQKVGEDTDQRSPAEIELPGEGQYGFRLVAVNGNGFGGKAPSPGDAPSTTIEVDLASPVIQSFDVDSVKNGQLEIRWRVTDANLAPEPINLYWSTQRSGPWTPIAFKVKNDGAYRWTLPRESATQVYVRVEAFDLAGNNTRIETQTPILLDTTEPDVNVLGVTAIPTRAVMPVVPSGN